MVKLLFQDKDLEQLATTGKNKRYDKYSKDAKFLQSLRRKLTLLQNAESVKDYPNISCLHYEKLRHQLSGISSVRIMEGRVERLHFTEHDNSISITIIELNTDHHGNKH